MSSGGGGHTRQRHATTGQGAAGAVTRDTHGYGYSPVPVDPYYGSFIDREAINMTDIPAGVIDGATHILPGSVGYISFDPTPPALPTGLTLSSAVVTDADGHAILNLIITLVQPTDADLHGTWVQFTNLGDGGDPEGPDWDRPAKVFIAAGQTKASIEGVAGSTKYWARAYAQDVQGNVSAMTAVVSHVTGKDATAPPVPDPVTVLAGFRGFSARWPASSVADMMFHEVRWAPDDGTGLAPDTNSWVVMRTKANTVFVGDLVGEATYWVQVRSVDLSGNVATSLANSTAVDYATNPEAGWTTAQDVTTVLIGSNDIAANSVTAAHVLVGSLNADVIGSGTIVVRPTEAFARGFEVRDAVGDLLGRWDETGLKIIDPANVARYVLLDAGQVKFTTDAGATFPAAITPEGINATAVNFGALPGGHNLVLNSSFELADFVAAVSAVTYTDTVGWAAGNRTVAPDNVTEGTSLSITTAGYV